MSNSSTRFAVYNCWKIRLCLSKCQKQKMAIFSPWITMCTTACGPHSFCCHDSPREYSVRPETCSTHIRGTPWTMFNNGEMTRSVTYVPTAEKTRGWAGTLQGST